MLKTKTAKELGVSPPYARHAMAYVLAGGRGSRLLELTDRRAKPAVYFGGKSRIIDFALSNALNSGIRRIAVATQYKAHSLIRHLQRGWNFFRPGAQRKLRHPARFAARVRDDVVSRHRRRGLSEHRHHRELSAPSSWSCWPAITSTRWTTRRCCSSTSTRTPTSPSAASRPRSRKPEASASCMSTPRTTIIEFLEKPKNPPPMPGKPDVALVQHGHLCVRDLVPDRPSQARRGRLRIRATISARTSFPTSSRTAKRSRITSRSPA